MPEFLSFQIWNFQPILAKFGLHFMSLNNIPAMCIMTSKNINNKAGSQRLVKQELFYR
jgi:hypothetical protein